MSPLPNSWWRGFTAPGLEAPPAAAPAPPALPTSGSEEAQTPVCTFQVQTPVTLEEMLHKSPPVQLLLPLYCWEATAAC